MSTLSASSFANRLCAPKGLIVALALYAAASVLFGTRATISAHVVSGARETDSDRLGQYAVGHTSFVIEDGTRLATLNTASGQVDVPRPIALEVFYPVDAETIHTSTPQAVYSLDMIYKSSEPAFQTTSSEWEALGIDRAYQEAIPSSARRFPLVMFSPGLGAAAWSALFVGTRLASHGFVVVVLSHYGERVWPHEPAADPVGVAALNRTLDVSFALTNLLTRNDTPGDLLSNMIDAGTVAAAGWSLGGYAAMALTAGDDLVCDHFPKAPLSTCVPVFPDPRIRAIAILDGSTQLLWFHELARIVVPTLGIGEEWSTLAADPRPGWASWQARLHAASQGHPSYRVDVAGTKHPTFSNLCEALPILRAHGLISQAMYTARLPLYCGAALPTFEAHRIATQYMVAFLKTTLAGDAGHQDVLTPGYALTREPAVEFFVTERRNAQAIDADWPDLFFYFPHQPGSEQAQAEKDPSTEFEVPHFGVTVAQ